MKYTQEQKARLKGMCSFIELKHEIGRELKLKQNKFTIKDDFIVIESKMNRNRHLRKC